MTSRGIICILRAISCLALATSGTLALRAKDKPKDAPSPLNLQVDSTPIDRDSNERLSYAPIVKKASPSVVYVYSTKKVRRPDMSQLFSNPMFRRFFGQPDQGGGDDGNADGSGGGGGGNGSGGDSDGSTRHGNRGGNHDDSRGGGRFEQQTGLGSGVVVSADGYILTNNHVVEGADDIQVKFGTPEKEYKATVIGHDNEADVAVLKIDATGLTPAVLGDSDQLQVGDTVLAIGDPFAIGLTVTRGIVSALGRNNLQIEDFEDFIQTDAPINQGNSGGALIDALGRVVGINTAIYSASGGSNGVGLAIPINLVRSIAQQLINTGRVARGFLGVELQALNPDLAAQFGSSAGALVSDVRAGTPADKAGVKSGDLITKMNGKLVVDHLRLKLAISQLPPGSAVTLDYLRDGKPGTVTITLGERPAQNLASGDTPAHHSDEGVLNGVEVGDITAELRDQLGLPAERKGAVITAVDPDSASARAGLAKGDVILDLNRKPVSNADEAVKLSDQIPGPTVLVHYWRQGGSQFVVVDESKK
jgi:serine protease Do